MKYYFRLSHHFCYKCKTYLTLQHRPLSPYIGACYTQVSVKGLKQPPKCNKKFNEGV